MAFQVSPGIDVREFDLTTTVAAAAANVGGISGVFRWGPVGERVLIGSENDLVATFGKPFANTTWTNVESFFSAADFLDYADALWVVRADTTGLVTANTTNIEAKYPGALGNSISVVYVDGGAQGTANDDVAAYGTTRVELQEDDHLTVIVVDTDGAFTGTANTVLEVFEDMAPTAGTKYWNGESDYIVDVINNKSKYIKFASGFDPATLTTAGSGTVDLANGADGTTDGDTSLAAIKAGFDLFENPEEVEVGLLIQGKAIGTDAGAEIANYIIAIAESRKDCMAFVSPGSTDLVGATSATALTTVSAFGDAITSSSYGVIDSGYKYRYNKYNDTYVWVPLNGDIAGITARTDDVRDPWYSPAGLNRGILKNVVKLAYTPKKADRDVLYQKNVNPVVTQPGTGTLLFGDKTALKTESAFSRINVRRLFITLEKSIANSAKGLLFEFNDAFTRSQFVNLVEPYLRDVQGRRGIYDFRVICDETNNTPAMIDRNEFRGDIYIKPARSINYIQLNFVAVATGVEFDEVIGRF